MSNLTKEQQERIRSLRWAADGNRLEAVKDLSRADFALLVKYIDTVEPDESASAGELLPWVLDRLQKDRDHYSSWLADAIEQARMAELCVLEADQAIAAVQKLIGGDLYVAGAAINARWDAAEDDYLARGLLPTPAAAPEPPASEPESAADAPPPEREPEPPPAEPLPPALIAQLSKPAQRRYYTSRTQAGWSVVDDPAQA